MHYLLFVKKHDSQKRTEKKKKSKKKSKKSRKVSAPL